MNSGHARLFLEQMDHFFFRIGSGSDPIGCPINHILVDRPLCEAGQFAEGAHVALGLYLGVEAIQHLSVVDVLWVVRWRGFLFRIAKLQESRSHLYSILYLIYLSI